MSAHGKNEPPDQPLCERDDRIGALLREGNAQFQRDIDPRAALLRLDARLERRRQRALRAPAWAFALPVAVLAVAVLYGPVRDGQLSSTLRLVPEQAAPVSVGTQAERKAAEPVPTAEGAGRMQAQRGPAPVRDGRPSQRHTREPASKERELRAERAPGTVSDRKVEAREPASTVATREDCAAQVKAQDFRAAARCYELQSKGTGLTAEFALFELARLRMSALNDARGAVSALEEHQRRFATGALTHQAQVALSRARAALGRPAAEVQPLTAPASPEAE